MNLYTELSASIAEVMDQSSETQEFKGRLAKLIENYFSGSYQDSDISELIELVQMTEEQINEY